MASAPHSFRRAVQDRKQKKRPHVEFELVSETGKVDEEGNPILKSDIFHASMPSDERLFFLAAMAGDEDAGVAAEAAATIDLLKSALPEEEFKTLRSRLLDPDDDVDMEMLQEVIPWLMEEWSGFPTEPSSDSSASQGNSGTKSTGRAPGKGSTLSATQ
jgi:hypothetical protein